MSFLARSRGLVVLATAAVAVAGCGCPGPAAPSSSGPPTGRRSARRHPCHGSQGVPAQRPPPLDRGHHQHRQGAGYFPIAGAFPTSADMDTSRPTASPPRHAARIDVDGITGDGNSTTTSSSARRLTNGTVSMGNNLTNSYIAANRASRPLPAPTTATRTRVTLVRLGDGVPAGEALAGGFSLGSGIKGDGMIERMRYGSTVYEFTNMAEAQDGAGRPGRPGRCARRHGCHRRHRRDGCDWRHWCPRCDRPRRCGRPGAEGRRRGGLVLLRARHPRRPADPHDRPRCRR